MTSRLALEQRSQSVRHSRGIALGYVPQLLAGSGGESGLLRFFDMKEAGFSEAAQSAQVWSGLFVKPWPGWRHLARRRRRFAQSGCLAGDRGSLLDRQR